MQIDKLDIETARYILHLRNQLDIAEAAIAALLQAQVMIPIKKTLDLERASADKNAAPLSTLSYRHYNLMFCSVWLRLEIYNKL